jgi:hypothetical protein
MLALHLFVQLYRAKDDASFQRMIDCILSNASQDFVEHVTVLCENISVRVDHSKITTKTVTKRHTYADMLKEASSYVKASHFALANSDIYLEDGFERLMDKMAKPHYVASITRHEINGVLHQDPKLSQDLWLFKRHSPSAALLNTCEYHLGIAGCEHMFAMSLYSHGYNIWNPCLDCKIVHADPSPRSVFPSRYFGPYLFLRPCLIEEIGACEPGYEVNFSRSPFIDQRHGPFDAAHATH